MAKTKVSEFDAVASNNTDINSVNVAEGCPPSGINNAIREMASLLKKQEVGTDAMTSPDINGGTIDGATIGGSSGVTIGVSDGTVSAPSIKFTSDTNTGIYRGGTDILKFVTAGTDAITIDASQDVTLAGSMTGTTVTLSTSDNNPQLTITSTDADANAGPEAVFDRNSSSPADADRIGKLTFKGRNDANQVVEYGNIQSRIIDASDGTEDGRIIIQNIIAGDVAGVMESNGTETIFNENSKDLDFRIESDSNANAFFLEGSSSNVGIGTSSPNAKLTSATTDGGSAFSIHRDFSGDVGASETGTGSFNFTLTDTATTDQIVSRINSVAVAGTGDAFAGAMRFYTAGNDGSIAERIRIDNNGEVTIQGDAKKLIFGASADSDMAHYADGQFAFRNTDAQGFVFYTGAGPTERVRIDANGHVTMPYQPAFQATSSNIANMSSGTVLPFGNEIFDQNADYNNSTYIFTAPVTGKYQLNATIRTDNVDQASNYVRIYLKTSNRFYESIYGLGGMSSDPSYWTFTIAVLADMDLGDTAFLEWNQSSGSNQTGLGSGESSFSGYLVA